MNRSEVAVKAMEAILSNPAYDMGYLQRVVDANEQYNDRADFVAKFAFELAEAMLAQE